MRFIARIGLLGLLALLLTVGCSAPGKNRENPAEVHYMLGMSFLGEQNPTAALREFLKAAEIAPDRADVQQALAQAYHQKQAFAEAEKHYRRALELAPDSPQVENNLAALYLDMQRWDDAIRYFRKASRNLLFDRPEIALTGLGFAQVQKGDLIDAVGTYKEALRVNPRYAQTHYRLGQAYSALDKTGLAVEAYRNALDLMPAYVPPRYHLGVAYLKLNQPEKAREQFEDVLERAPESKFGQMSRDYLKLL